VEVPLEELDALRLDDDTVESVQEELTGALAPSFAEEGVGGSGTDVTPELQALRALEQRLSTLGGGSQAQAEALGSIAQLQAAQAERQLQQAQDRARRDARLAEARAVTLAVEQTLATGETDVTDELAVAVDAAEAAADEARQQDDATGALFAEQAGAALQLAAEAADRRDVYAALNQLRVARLHLAGTGDAAVTGRPLAAPGL
jgi:multidrug efflux pump subunit AcrA (membrane-fusion protein)